MEPGGVMTGISGRGAVARGRLRAGVLLASSAVGLALTAQAVQAQCTSSQGRNPFDFGVTSSGASSAVQSIITVLSTTNTAFLTQTTGFIGAPANPGPDQPGGGVWTRGIGGTNDTRVPGNYAYSPSLLGSGGSGNCNVRTFQDYGGVQLGTDISHLNINGANVHVGVTGGYSESYIRSPTGTSTLNGEFQIPFVGIYAAVTKDGYFADTQARWDFYQGLLNDPTNALANQRLDARSFSITGNLGKQFPLGDNFFIEPSVGVVYTQAKVDPLKLTGTIFLANSPGLGAPAVAKINDFDSILGRASIRVGYNFLYEGLALQPFFTASVFNEFAGTVRTNVNTTFGGFAAAANQPGALAGFDTNAVLNTGRIGTYGQFGLGLAGQILNTGWLGYIRGDVRTGDRIEGLGISAGIRYQFNPEPVAAAGIVRKGATPTLLPVLDGPVNWTGFSVGGSVGGTWGYARQTIAGYGAPNPDFAGVLVGGQVGADYQFATGFGGVVVGAAGDAHYTNARGGRGCPNTSLLFFYNCETESDVLTMATARIGYAYERTLFYVKGGAAFGDLTERALPNSGNQPLIVIGVPPTFTSRGYTAVGWTVGAGFEFALSKNWSAKAEYMHYELERRNVPFPVESGAPPSTAQHTGDLVRVGVNYRFTFDPAPDVLPARTVVAKY